MINNEHASFLNKLEYGRYKTKVFLMSQELEFF
jgi:hypothetical protein